MAKLVYSAIASLDGYVADAHGRFDWAAPDEEVHAFVNDRERPIGTYLYGRRMYDVMRVWDTMPDDDTAPAVMRDYANVWRAADKVVYSTTLDEPSTARTRLVRSFEPDEVRRLKSSLDQDISVGGPGLAAHALSAGLVDECHLFLTPVVVGAGTPVFQTDRRLDLELCEEHRFGSGVVHLGYRIRS
jgi:dihydrofolate reductase